MEYFSRSRQSYTAVYRECTVLQVLYLNHPTRLAGFYPSTSMKCVTPEFVDVAKSHLKNLKHGFACGTEGRCTESMMCLSEFQIERKKCWTHQGLCMKGNFSIWKAPVDYLADWKTVWPKNLGVSWRHLMESLGVLPAVSEKSSDFPNLELCLSNLRNDLGPGHLIGPSIWKFKWLVLGEGHKAKPSGSPCDHTADPPCTATPVLPSHP